MPQIYGLAMPAHSFEKTNLQITDTQENSLPVSIRQEVAGLRNQTTRHADECDKATVFQEALANSGRGELKQVVVNLGDGVIQLRGVVTSYFLKQAAQETVRPLAIGLRIDNQLCVSECVSKRKLRKVDCGLQPRECRM